MISAKIILVGMLLFFLGCKTAKNETPKESSIIVSQKENKDSTAQLSNDNCPEDGTCSWSIQLDTKLVLKEDTIGALYPVFEKETGTQIIKFEYKRKTEKGLADGSYTELIYFQIPDTTKSLTLKDQALKDVGLTYARLCFCRGTTGYIPVNNGNLILTKTVNEYRVQLTFENGKYPQIINNLDGIVSVITE